MNSKQPSIADPPSLPSTRRDALRFAGLLALGLIAPSTLVGCGGGGQEKTESELQQLLLDNWKIRYAAKPGGLSLKMISSFGSYFASTIEGVDAGCHFRGASTTKTFTSAAIMLLDQKGLLRIDDRVTGLMPGRSDSYLPQTPDYAIPYKDQITIRQLLQHRAGIFDVANQAVPLTANAPYAGQVYVAWRWAQDNDHTFTKDELVGVVASNQLSFAPPGNVYHYADTGYTLLGKIVEQVSGQPLDVFKTRELLLPNGLTQTHFVTDGREWNLPSPFIAGFSLGDGQIQGPVSDVNASYDPGSGNVITTPSDLARWVRRLLRGEAGIALSQIARMCDVMPDSNYGLGLLHKVGSEYDLGFGHNGGMGGYLTDAYHDPKTDVSYVLQSSLIDFDDLLGQMHWLSNIAVSARSVLGY